MKKRETQGGEKGRNSEAAAQRAARQAQALRANLKRRKEQTRARHVVARNGEEDGAGEG
ncbi:MAG: hypothetical protein ACTSX7_06840 [Alphaproteobacteria bacterium]